MSTETVTSSTPESLTGRVKWFNNKTGYGFITIADGAKAGDDIFVHHSAVNVSDQQYKFLVQGEYVEFVLTAVEGGKHPFQAANVSGIKGGKLMCETRNETKNVRKTYKSDTTVQEGITVEVAKTPRASSSSSSAASPRPRGEGPRDAAASSSSSSSSQTWKVVEGNTPAKRRGRPPRAAAVAAESR